MARQIQILRQELNSFPKVKSFLDSIGRESRHSRSTYATGFVHFQKFLEQSEKDRHYTPESITAAIKGGIVDVYELLESFVAYLHGRGQAPKSVRLNISAMKSYFATCDIDIVPQKFKRRVRPPKIYREDEEALSARDIRNILLACNNRRLKPYLLVLATGGMRAVEGLAIRVKDIDFSTRPVTVTICKEYSKTKRQRKIFISDEAAHYLQDFMNFKYRHRMHGREDRTRNKDQNDLVFSVKSGVTDPNRLYGEVNIEFMKVLDVAGYAGRKDGMRRHLFTLHSFRRFTKTILSDNISMEYSEWFLGHAKSPYWTRDPEHKKAEYIRVMKFLTFLDFSMLEAKGKSIAAQLSTKDEEIEALKQGQTMLKSQMAKMQEEFQRIMNFNMGERLRLEKYVPPEQRFYSDKGPGGPLPPRVTSQRMQSILEKNAAQPLELRVARED
jgi:integrase